jgi:hypothetical protein
LIPKGFQGVALRYCIPPPLGAKKPSIANSKATSAKVWHYLTTKNALLEFESPPRNKSRVKKSERPQNPA